MRASRERSRYVEASPWFDYVQEAAGDRHRVRIPERTQVLLTFMGWIRMNSCFAANNESLVALKTMWCGVVDIVLWIAMVMLHSSIIKRNTHTIGCGRETDKLYHCLSPSILVCSLSLLYVQCMVLCSLTNTRIIIWLNQSIYFICS